MRSRAHTALLPFGLSARVSPKAASKRPASTVAGLFAGIGGIELGLRRAGHESSLLCELDPAAAAVLAGHFRDVPNHDDITTLKSLPRNVDLITAGFPCQDLSQAGQTAGLLKGKRSSLVSEVFRLIRRHDTPTVVLENVPFMLKLGGGAAMAVIASAFEEMGYMWAYRVIDSRAFGLPQRRERVVFVASKVLDPRAVLFGDETEFEEPLPNAVGRVACGFYWTEGLRGLGWAVDAVPTLKGGSTIGIPSPPAIVLRSGLVVTPDIRDAERMQGFPADWTAPAAVAGKRSHRWKLAGNAVTVDVFAWVGRRLRTPCAEGFEGPGTQIQPGVGWPATGWNVGAGRCSKVLSSHPVAVPRVSLEEWLQFPTRPLSSRAIRGFLSRAERSSLRFPPRFLDCLRRQLATQEQAPPRPSVD